ncbi:MAG: phosphodiester glycosidase family protein [Candidatus Eremiobacteraeota bacterium]|nr:phosphodiester glycosidase family protein [Candidatus Eremiobacteraeota bacterium]
MRRFRAFATLCALAALFAAGVPVAVRAAELPAALAPLAPFPLVTGSSVEREAVAPGVARATYRLLTSAGPLVVSVVTVDPREPTVRLGTVLANDRIVSKDEPVSSMARRTGAVAGINGDYFDIGASGAPLGVLIRNGALERTPSARVALTVARDRSVRFETYRFSGSVTSGAVTVPISALNEWPPQGGAVVLTPAFGTIPPSANGVTLLDLQPLASDAGGARYRVAAVTNAPPWPAPGALRLAYGPAAQNFRALPDVGDVVRVAFGTEPPLADVAAAIGGGPELLHAGAPVDDPASPNYADRDRRIPAAAAARFPDGTLALVVVDGRHPATSIGVNRGELIALLRALGASDAMLFDSGGSATLVARVLGDAEASVVNEPSDGIERPVADGLFVYSDAPLGPPARLILRPARIVALPGARVALRARVVDANDHGLGDARGAWRIAPTPLIASIGEDDTLHAGERAGSALVHVARGGVATDLPVDVVDRVARIVIGPARANPDPHAALTLSAEAFDSHDRPVAVDGLVRWSARDASIDARGRLLAGERDAQVTASAGGASVSVTIPVGKHTSALALFDDAHRAGWKLVTTPAGGAGAVSADGERLQIAYDFSAGERAAYAVNETPLGEPVALACAIDGDANGAALRATFSDRYGDRQTVTFARAIDFAGTRRLGVAVPRSLAPPIALRNFYVVGTLANPPLTAAGTVGVHDCVATFPGAQAP